MSIRTFKKTFITGEVCAVEVEFNNEEKGCGECPDYPASANVISITLDGEDVTKKFSPREIQEIEEDAMNYSDDEASSANLEETLYMRGLD